MVGRRVVAVDTDLAGGNLHTVLGVVAPRASLADYVAKREPDLRKLLVDTPFPGLRLIAGTHGHLGVPQPWSFRRVALLGELRKLPADFLLVDLGAGTHPSVMDYFLVGGDGTGHWKMDLARLARLDLERAGLARDRIAAFADACTACDPARFYSYRREGPGAGRLVHFVMARASGVRGAVRGRAIALDTLGVPE